MGRTYRLVVGVDGSPASLRALRWAAEQAQAKRGSVLAVSVYDEWGVDAAVLAGLGPEGERRRAHDCVSAAVEKVHESVPAAPIMIKVVKGDAATNLADLARGADLLVVGGCGHGRLHRAVLGSVSEGCIRLATCPVVVIPASVNTWPAPDQPVPVGAHAASTA